jgi:hypothetical protein
VAAVDRSLTEEDTEMSESEDPGEKIKAMEAKMKGAEDYIAALTKSLKEQEAAKQAKQVEQERLEKE